MVGVRKMGLARMLQGAWTRRGPLAQLLRPFSWMYRALWAMRKMAYRSGLFRSLRLPAVVVVVGNVVAGGGGKTPVVIALARHLARRPDVRVGIISRGYGRKVNPGRSAAVIEVQPHSDASEVGDEPLLLSRSTGLPVFVGRNRLSAGQALLAAHPGVNLIICDDGLQHLALQRDIEICAFDDRGIGNGLLLPAGPLREPWPRPTNLLLHTGNLPAFYSGFRAERSLADHLVASDGTLRSWASLDKADVHAVAGIARPEAFFQMLRERGLHLTRNTALPDHYDFHSWLRPSSNRETVICTEKDAVKLWTKDPQALAVPLLLRPEAAFFAAFDEQLTAQLSSNTPL